MIQLYDTTLRDGAQREGVSITVEDKLRIAQRLDALGVHFIEAGFPASNATDSEFFERARSCSFKHATLCAFGKTTHKDTNPADDSGIQALVSCPAQLVTLVGKAWELHSAKVLGVTAVENLRMISSSIAYLTDKNKSVFFDAEHYFDGYKTSPEFALNTLKTAHESGALALILCDTNGGALPHEVYEIARETISWLKANQIETRLGIHAHNDNGCGVANTLEAVRAGVTQVQGTVNGYGERVGNADLLTILANLQLKLGYSVVSPTQLATLSALSHFVSETFNAYLDPYLPYVGQSSFAHKGGLHASAEVRQQHAYEHINPENVGNFAHFVVSELAGKASLVAKADELGIKLPSDDTVIQNILNTIKERESYGYSYEVADASLSLLIKRELGQSPDCFSLESFKVYADKCEDGCVISEATIKITVGDEYCVATGHGNGPINALDAALRLAIGRFYPEVEQLELTDYKVRVLDAAKGTGAVTRVLIETSDGSTVWRSIGVSENVIEASWDALVDAITYGLLLLR